MSTSGHPADVPVRILGGELGGAVDVVSLAISSSLEVMDPIPDDDVDEDDDMITAPEDVLGLEVVTT